MSVRHRCLDPYENMFRLTLCILMNFLINIDIISMGLPTVYVRGSRVVFSKLSCTCLSVPEGCFNLSKQCRP